MGTGAAHIHARHRSAVLGVTREGAIEQQLVEGEFTLENIALGEADLGLYFPGGTRFAVQNQAFEIGAMGRYLVDHRLLESGPVGVGPLPAVDPRRRVLHEHGHHMLAGGRHGGVGLGGDQHIDVGVLRPGARLPVVVGALQSLQRIGKMHIPQHQRIVPVQAIECGQPVQGDIELAGGAANLEIPGFVDKFRRQIIPVHDIEEGAPGIEVGYDDSRRQFITVFKSDPADLAVPDHDPVHIRIADNVTTKGLDGLGQRSGHRPHAPAGKSPGADIAVHIPHVMVQQHVGRAGGVHPQGGTDDTGAAEVGFDHVTFEVFVEVVSDALGPEPQRVGQALLPQLGKRAGKTGQVAQVAQLQRGRVRRAPQQVGADESGLFAHVSGVAFIGIGVAQ